MGGFFRRRHRSRHRTAPLFSPPSNTEPVAPPAARAPGPDLTTPFESVSDSKDDLLTPEIGHGGAGTAFSAPDTEPTSTAAGFGWPEAADSALGGEHKEISMPQNDTDSINGEQPSTRLAKNSRISGKLNFEGTVLIEGHVEGEINAQDRILIGDTAVVNAELIAGSVVITGTVTGDITAMRRVEIRAPGKVHGKVTTPSLVIHEGVVFDGQCLMSGLETGRADDTPPLPPAENGGTPTGSGVKIESEVEW